MNMITLQMITQLRAGIVCVVALVGWLTCQTAVAVPTDLHVSVDSPAQPTESDIVTLLAGTLDDILPSTSWQTVTTSLEVNGFDINWTLISNDTGLPGAAVLTPAFRLEDIGPLPAGTYNVTATWAMYDVVAIGVPPFIIGPPIQGPRMGATQFTVVPEPAVLMMMSSGLCLLGMRRSR